ncbi:MAG: biopolymer transporter ExbD [Planctomycetota bacterium]
MAKQKKSSPASEAATEEIKIEMTPMIDVTFLLLIFFLCSIKFKILEGKLQTYLPKDVGVNSTPQMKMLEKIDIRIDRIENRSKKNLENIDVYRQWIKDGAWQESQVEIRLQGVKVKDLHDLFLKLKEYRKNIPAPVGDEEDELKMNLEAMKGVIYEDVIKVVDVAILANFSSITFRGIEMDA